MNQLNELKSRFLRELEVVRQLAPKTIGSHLYVVDTLLGFVTPRRITKPSEITRDVILDYFAWGRAERYWKPATARWTHYKNLNVFFEWLVEFGHVEANPLEKIPPPRLEVTVPISLSQEQAEGLLAVACDHFGFSPFERVRNHALVALLLMTGLRRGEAAKLKLEDVDQGVIRVKNTKTHHDRLVPIHPSLQETLDEYLRERARFLERLSRRSTALFVSVSDRRYEHMTGEGVSQVIRRLSRLAGLPKGMSAHKLRHTFATQLLNGREDKGGVDVAFLQRLLGHQKLTTTAIYLHATTKDLAREILKHPLDIQPIGPLQARRPAPKRSQKTAIASVKSALSTANSKGAPLRAP